MNKCELRLTSYAQVPANMLITGAMMTWYKSNTVGVFPLPSAPHSPRCPLPV
jgi:hypothetical protein